jgi:hypothetical protein
MGDLVPWEGRWSRHTMKTAIIFFYANELPYAMEVLDREPSSRARRP